MAFTLSKEQFESIAALGFNLYQQGRLADAKTIFAGLTAFDQVYFGYAGLGAIALAEEPPQLEVALTNLRRAAEINPNDPSVRANLGETLLRMARFGEAAAEFEKALELDPEEVDAGANRARAIIGGMHVVIGEMQKTSPANKPGA